jgi:steroid 5-alpha reductase family enzyme
MTAIFTTFLLITVVNVLAYVWAYKKQSDHLTDISYSACFIAVAFYFLFAYQDLTGGRLVYALMILMWGVRLGGFLFYRINKMGRDTRFDEFRGNKTGFLKFWLLQSLSIWIIALPIMLGLSAESLNFSFFAFAIWMTGWIIESVADWQKFIYRKTHAKDDFISTGLYRYIRHPNYLGEILVWTGVFIYSIPVLVGWLWLSVVSPLWLIFLLVFLSGIPLIDQTNLVKYKDNEAFEKYKKSSWRLIPFIY